MQKRIMNIFGVLLLSVIGSMTALAQAVVRQPAEPPQAPQIARAGNGSGVQEGLSLDATPATPSIGWNYVHPVNCDVYNNYLYVYTKEGPYFWTNDFQLQTLEETDCQIGNWLAFYIYDNNGDWDAVYTYQYK